MNNKKLKFSLLLIQAALTFGCAQKELTQQNESQDNPVSITDDNNDKKMHPYGGWYCPDNLFGFPPINITDWQDVPVVNGRLPTKEETRNGTSLMYFDTNEIPSAKPLDMIMPRLGRYYSKYTEKNELVIVIQVVVAESDTVVGFRYLNGGNGSAWFSDVDFLNEKEMKNIKAAPFISIYSPIKAKPEQVWDAITNPAYSLRRNQPFGGAALISSSWTKDAKVDYLYAPNSFIKEGKITALWENLYVQIDYNFDGVHYVQKILMLEDKETGFTNLSVISGPNGNKYDDHQRYWEEWVNIIKEISEKK